jgi:hypothetical protein
LRRCRCPAGALVVALGDEHTRRLLSKIDHAAVCLSVDGVGRVGLPRLGSDGAQPVVRWDGGCWPLVDGVNDFGVVDAAQIHRGDREIGMAELALDHQ